MRLNAHARDTREGFLGWLLAGALNRTGREGGTVGCWFKHDGVPGKCCVCTVENKGQFLKLLGDLQDPCEQF